jgi:hypothetical protein
MTHVVTAENACCGHHGYITDLGPGDKIVITCCDCGEVSRNLHWTAKEDACEQKQK